MSRFFNFAQPPTSQYRRGDPFLISTSMADNTAVGNIRGIRKSRVSSKQIIPLTIDEIKKAKACEEMIMFEKMVAVNTDDETTLNNRPNAELLKEFKNALETYTAIAAQKVDARGN